MILLIIEIFLAGYLFSVFPAGPQKSWKVIQSPTRNKISFIVALENDNAIAASNKLFLYNSNQWKEFPVQPPVTDISRLFVLNEKVLWVALYNINNESDFYSFKYNKWRKTGYPLVNGIQAASLKINNNGWYCGDREIAYQQNGKHYYIPYPDSPDPVIACYGPDRKNLWVQTFGNKFYYFNGINWEEPFPGKFVSCFYFNSRSKGFAVVGDSLFQYKNDKWELISQHELLTKITKIVNSGNEFWGIGQNGLLIHYRKYWYTVNLPVKVDLFDISFSKNGTGWIAGDKGIIIKYTSENVKHFLPQPGFNRTRILSLPKEMNNEYGVVMEDFDNDGYKDLYATCIYEPNRLYLYKPSNNKNNFIEDAISRNVSGRIIDKKKYSFSEYYIGAGSADIDNDGDQDLYLCNLLNENKMLINNGNGDFRDVSSQNDRATERKERTNSAVFSDVDSDGDLDLFIANEYSSNRLYLNNGYGYFKDVTEKVGLLTDYGGMGSVFSDIDGDSDPDLFVVNWSRPNILYENVSSKNDGVKFINISESAGLSKDSVEKSNAAVFADYDNDGDPDLYVTNRRLSNRLYRNEGNKRFMDVTKVVLGIDSMYSYGACFADFDNDGYLDLFVANIGDNKLFRNLQGKRFTDVTRIYGVELGGYSTGCSSGDIDNDGDIDFYVANFVGDNSMLFLNNINDKNFIKINVQGVLSNRDAVGVKAWIYPAGKSGEMKHLLGFREISGGSGYSSKDCREIHFGVKEGLYDIVIIFPASGIEKVFTDIKNSAVLKVNEVDGFYAYFFTALTTFKRLLYNRENQKEVIKFIFVLLVIGISFSYGLRRYNWKRGYFIFAVLPILGIYFLQINFLRYENFFYSTITPIGSVIIIFSLIHIYFERNLMKERLQEEKQKTRDALARDLHDDLASTISSALIYTDMVRSFELNDKSNNLLTKVHNLLKEAAGSVTDIIWTVSPRHDNIEDLVTRLQLLMNDLCRVNSIEFKTKFDLDNSVIRVSDSSRRNIYLIYKEAINNIIKHSSASKVEFNVYIDNDLLNFSLYDNGVGFDSIQMNDILDNPGHGLRNIKARAGDINADVEIISSKTGGTFIKLRQKIA